MAQGTNYTVQIVLKAKNMMASQVAKVDKGLKSLASNAKSLGKALGAAMGKTAATKAANFGKAFKSIGGDFKSLGRSMEFAEAKQILFTAAVKAYQAVKQGAAINQQKKALDGLAQTYGSTGRAITEAMQKSSDYTIDKMSAVTAANKAMILDVAKSPEEFGRLAKVATVLGRAMGQDATKSIDDFVTAAGRQSKLIADNLGLMVSATDANKRWAAANNTTVAAMDDAAKKQAFLTEMLRQGEAKMADMGGQTESTAVKMAQMETSYKDAGNELLGLIATLQKYNAYMGWTNEAMKIAAGLASQLNIIVTELSTKKEREAAAVLATSKAYDSHLIKTRNVVQATKDYRGAMDDADRAVLQHASNVGDSTTAFDQYSKAVQASVDAQDAAIVSSKTYSERQVDLLLTQKKLVAEQAELAKEQAAAAAIVTQKTGEALLDQGMAWTSYFADRKEQRTENVKTIRDIEAEHQANMVELQKKGQSRAISINANAEQSKLDTLKQKLSLALLQQSEFTDKTKESTRIRKENQIAGLQTQIGTQTTLLDDFYNGRLIAQGENITAGLAAENERYAQEKAIAQEARAAQEEEMRLSLGRMVLQQFEAWATIRGIPAEEMLKMKNQIAVDYGLMTEEGALAADLQIDIWEQWAEDMNVSTKSVVAEMNTVSANAQAITRNLNLIPREINIDITTTERRREVTESIARRESQRGPGGGGANFSEGGDFTVPRGFENDSFPMHVSSGERVIVIPRDQNTTNNFNQTINTRSSSAAQAGFRVMQSMAQ